MSRDRFRRAVALRKKGLQVDTYQSWLKVQSELSSVECRETWRDEDASQHYEAERVSQARTMLRDEMHQAKLAGDPRKLVQLLRSMMNRDFAQINNPSLYQYVGVGTKKNIEEFLAEVSAAILEIVRISRGNVFSDFLLQLPCIRIV